MYRIKTDIRQYKCESKDKVEKLIRNWVIRPNDLIYDADQKAWSPIGEHPSFLKLFGMLDAEVRAEPDTVVTEAPSRSTTGLGNADSEEITNVKARPTQPDTDDVRETDVIDQTNIAKTMTDEASVASDTPAPPEAPDGVEPPVQSDEVTLMTEKTLDLLTITDEDEAAQRTKASDEPAKPSPTVIVEEGIEDSGEEDGVGEVTQVRNEDDVEAEDETLNDAPEASEEEAEGEATQLVTADTHATEEPRDETTQVREEVGDDEETKVEESPLLGSRNPEDNSEVLEKGDDDSEVSQVAAASVRDSKLATSKPRGRHNLPEEFFATNEISPIDRDAPIIDELGELPEDSSEESVDEAWESMADDLRTTDEIDDPSTVEDSPTDEEESAPEEKDNVEPEPVGLDETTAPVDDDYAEDEWDEYEDELETQDGEEHLIPIDRVEDPYAIELPFEIAPDEADIAVGLIFSETTPAERERAFPYPRSKDKDRVYTSEFDLTPVPPEDRSFPFLVAVVVVIIALFALIYIVV